MKKIKHLTCKCSSDGRYYEDFMFVWFAMFIDSLMWSQIYLEFGLDALTRHVSHLSEHQLAIFIFLESF